MDREVLHPCPPDFSKQHRDTVDVGLASDDPHIRVAFRLMYQMLPTAEADLQPNGPFAEQRVEVERGALGVGFPTDSAG